MSVHSTSNERGVRGQGPRVALVAGLLVLIQATSAVAQRSDSSKEAREALNLANALVKEGKLKEADSKFRESIRADPGLEDAYRSYLPMLFVMGRYRDGVEVAREGLKILPDSILLKGQLGMHLYELGQPEQAHPYLRQVLDDTARFEVQAIAGQCCLQVKDYECAARALQSYIRYRPAKLQKRDLFFKMLLARALYSKGSYRRSEQVVAEVIALKADFLPALILGAAIDLKLGACAKAIGSYKGLRKRMARKEFIALLINLARGYMCLRRYHEALREVDLYLRHNPDSVDGLLLKADAAYQLKRYAAALETYTKVSRMTRAEPRVRIRIAKTLLYQKHYTRVLESVEGLLDEPQVSSEALILAIRAAIRSRKNALALQYGQKLLAPQQQIADHFYYGGLAHSAVGQFTRAVQLQRKALSLDPKHAAARRECVRALVHQARRVFGQGNPERAIVLLRRAKKLAPQVQAVDRNLALSHYRLGQDDKVLTYLQPILKKHPQDLLANRIAARVLLRLNRVKQARARIDTVLKILERRRGGALAHELAVYSNIQLRLGHFPEGIKALQRAIDLAWEANQTELIQTIGRNLARALVASGFGQLDRGKPGAAWKQLQRARDRSSDLSATERVVVQAAAVIGALAAGELEAFREMLPVLKGKGAKVLTPPFDKVGYRFLTAYGDYRSPEPQTKLQAGRQFEAIAQQVPAERGRDLLTLAVNACEQAAVLWARKNRGRQARQAMTSALQLAQRSKQPVHPAQALNSAVIDYMTGRQAEAVKRLELLKNRIGLSWCNLAVHSERVGAGRRSYELFKRCQLRGAPYPGLKGIVEAKERLYGEGAP